MLSEETLRSPPPCSPPLTNPLTYPCPKSSTFDLIIPTRPPRHRLCLSTHASDCARECAVAMGLYPSFRGENATFTVITSPNSSDSERLRGFLCLRRIESSSDESTVMFTPPTEAVWCVISPSQVEERLHRANVLMLTEFSHLRSSVVAIELELLFL